MAWIALLGVLLQVVGLLLAIKGIADTHQEFVGNSIWPPLVSAWRDWVVHGLFRRPRPPVKVSINAAFGSGAGASASAVVGLPQYDETDEVDARLNVLARSVEILEGRISTNRDYHKKQLSRAQTKLNDQIKDLEVKVDQANSRLEILQRATVGVEGKGLVETLTGFLITIVGVVFTIAGLSF